MRSLKPFLLSQDDSVRAAIEAIDRGAIKVALVVDESGRLQGTITDGDIRRGLLRGRGLEDRVGDVMFTDFRYLGPGGTRDDALKLMHAESLHQIPLLDADGILVDIFILEEILQPMALPNWVVLMAGGEGQRLRPITNAIAKPMVQVGDRPILQIILERCVEAGFRSVFISVNYLRDQIMRHFGDGSNWGVEIVYLEEEEPLGTAGALTLLPGLPLDPVVVINGDVLTRVDLPALLRFHSENKSALTMCVRVYETQIPFGVATTDGARLLDLIEKPVLTHYVNAGMYVLDPTILTAATGGALDMPDLVTQILERNQPVTVFPLHEYWLDVGNPTTLAQARGEWP